jgi:hypothetical protein
MAGPDRVRQQRNKLSLPKYRHLRNHMERREEHTEGGGVARGTVQRVKREMVGRMAAAAGGSARSRIDPGSGERAARTVSLVACRAGVLRDLDMRSHTVGIPSLGKFRAEKSAPERLSYTHSSTESWIGSFYL